MDRPGYVSLSDLQVSSQHTPNHIVGRRATPSSQRGWALGSWTCLRESFLGIAHGCGIATIDNARQSQEERRRSTQEAPGAANAVVLRYLELRRPRLTRSVRTI